MLLDAETTARIAADDALDDRIDSEAVVRGDADTALDTRVTALENSPSNEHFDTDFFAVENDEVTLVDGSIGTTQVDTSEIATVDYVDGQIDGELHAYFPIFAVDTDVQFVDDTSVPIGMFRRITNTNNYQILINYADTGGYTLDDDRVSALRAGNFLSCLLYTSPSPRDRTRSRMPSSA